MKKEIILVLFLFFTSFCFAQELNFQRENYSPSETIIGTLTNVTSELTAQDLKIYEGRREVFFEKGIVKANNVYYFYIIPTKAGEFDLKISNVLYNNSGILSSTNLERTINVSQSNVSVGYKVMPGVYEGQKPEFVITNLKSEKINLTLGNETIYLNSLESKRVTIETSEGFSLYKIGEYQIPIIFSKTTNQTSIPINETKEVESTFLDCINITAPSFFSLAINEKTNYTFEIRSTCLKDLAQVLLHSSFEGISFYEDNLTLYSAKMIKVNFSLIGKESGEYNENISLNNSNGTLASKIIKIYFFENKTNLENFQKISSTNTNQNCESSNGKFCTGKTSCSTENIFYDPEADAFCCLSECVDPNAKPTNWTNIAIALGSILLISAIIYLLIKRSKGFKAPKAEERFIQAEKKYERKFEPVKKENTKISKA